MLEAKTAIASSLKVPLMANPYLEGAAIVSPLSPLSNKIKTNIFPSSDTSTILLLTYSDFVGKNLCLTLIKYIIGER